MTGVVAPTQTRRVPAAARVLPGRVHYGWWIAVGSLVLLFVTVGVGYYGLAVFLGPLQDEHGWSNGVVSGATGLYFTASGLTGALIGPHIDRRGPLRLMTIGTLLLGVSVAAVGFVESVWQLYAVYLVMAVGFGLAASVGVNAMLARWFVYKRARAMSIAFTGVSLGGVVLAPLGTALVDSGGLSLATVVMGAIVVVVGLPVVRLLLVWDPHEMGLEPDAGAPPPGCQPCRARRRGAAAPVEPRRGGAHVGVLGAWPPVSCSSCWPRPGSCCTRSRSSRTASDPARPPRSPCR